MTDTRDGGGGPSIGNEGGGQSRWDRLRPFAEGITALTAIGALIFTGISVQQGRSQAKISEQGQYTDRYARAVEELGSTAVDVRLGGLYALERLASDSPRDVATIRQVVAAFVGDRAVYTKFLKSPDPGFLGRMLDIDAALTILSRMPKAGDPVNLGYARFTGVALDGDRFTGSLLSGTKFVQSGLQSANLTECDLRGADFSDANLEHADLSNSELSNAFLSADLVDAKLERADLTSAHLSGADARHAHLREAILTAADLQETNLGGADLHGAILTRAHLRKAKLGGADLRAANLVGADLRGADLRGAYYEPAQLAKANAQGAITS